MTDKEAMQMALDALLTWKIMHPDTFANAVRAPAIEALRARLARPEPEPVADGIQVIEHVRNVQYKIKSRYHLENGTELYTAPPQRPWQGLTDEEMRLIRSAFNDSLDTNAYCRAIEAALKEKNT